MISDLANPFYAGLASGAEEVLANSGLDLIIATARDDGERERTLIESLLERRVRGLMIVPSGEDYSYLHLERKRGFAFTFVDRPAPYLDADAVLVDNQGGVAICIDELLSQGCKKIALIADNPSIWTAAERITGFKKAALSRKLRSENALVVTGIHNIQEAESATHKLLEEDHIDAIIATNDLIAIGAGQVILSSNSRCKVISFDDFPSAKLMGIKTLDHDPVQLGKLAAQVLLNRMENPSQSDFVTKNMKLTLKNPTLKNVVNHA